MFGRLKPTFKNVITTIGFNNHTLNVINGDGSQIGFTPHVDWNETPQSGGGYSALLEWRTRLTPLIGRDAEQQLLLDWANESHALSFKVVEAAGGVGKTRLAAEVAQTLSETRDWSAGFVNLGSFQSAQRLQWQGNWFIVVDYPEHAPDRLAELMQAAKDGLQLGKHQKLRVLLLCRAQDGIGSKLNNAGVRGYVSQSLQLPELGATDNFKLLTQSLAALVKQAGRGQAVPEVNHAEFDAWQQQSNLHSTALFVVAQAIHLTSSPEKHQRFLPAAELLRALLAREQVRWTKAEQGHGLPPGTLADVVALATLFNGLQASDINNTVSTAFGWSGIVLGGVHTALVEVWHADRSGNANYPAMAPDLLAAVFLWDWQNQPANQGKAQNVAAFIQLALNREGETRHLLERWHMLAYDQTMRLMLGRPADAPALATLLQNFALLKAEFFEQLKHGFQSRPGWSALASLAAFTSKPQATVSLGEIDERTLARSASDLNNHAIDLAGSGDRAGALLAGREAVEIYKRLAQANPAAYEPDFAASLNNLANRLSETGDRAGAIALCAQALDLYEQANGRHAGLFDADIARVRKLLDWLNAA